MSEWEFLWRRRTASDLTTPVRSFAVDGALHLLEALGDDVDALCRGAEIDRERLDDLGYRVEAPQLLKLFAVAEQRSGDSLIGLHAAHRARFGSVPAHLVASQKTVTDAVAAQNRVQVLLLGAHAITVRRHLDTTYILLETGPDHDAVRHLTEYCIGSVCRLLGWLTLQAARPIEVHFRHRRGGDLAEYEAFFGCHVVFHAEENGAALSQSTMNERLVSANDELAEQLELLVRTEIDLLPPISFGERVALALRAGQLHTDDCRREVIARRLGVSTRTLHRCLDEEGTTFREIVDGVRRQLALELIADSSIRVADVGSTVGYADQYAFSKAFRRWTGVSPMTYRRQSLPDDNDR